MKVGILGGTFDPIHNGHIELGKAALLEFNLDKVLFVPAGNPYFKSGKRNISLAVHRKNLIELSISQCDNFEFSDIELYKAGETYTSDTLEKLKSDNPSNSYYYIVGADTLMQMDTWVRPDVIFNIAYIIVANRGNYSDQQLSTKIEELKLMYDAKIRSFSYYKWTKIDVSSSDIRKKINERNYNIDVSKPAISYIKKCGLYLHNPTTSQIKERLKYELTSHRYKHSLGVANTAYDLSLVHRYNNPEKAYLAGLLHDSGKPYASALEHASKGAEIAHNYYGIDDEEILESIRSHTIGSTHMSLLDKIIFLADFIEPYRTNFDGLEEIKALSYIDLDRAIVKSIEYTYNYLKANGQSIDEKSIEVYNYFIEITRNRMNLEG